MNKKVLYIVTNADLGGISKCLLEITKYLPDNIEPYFLMSSSGYLTEELEKIGISKDRMFFVKMTNSITDIFQHLKSNFKAIQIVRKIKPDIIHCNATTGSIVGAICGLFTRTPVLYSVHGWPFTDGIPKGKQIFYKILDTLICLLFKKITTETDYDTNQGIKLMPWLKNKIVTLHNGISDIPVEYKKTSFSENDIKILMIARYCPQKDPYTLIKAVGELNKEGYDIKLDLYGYGPEENAVVELINTYNTDNIRNCGVINDDIPIFKNYDIYSLISNWEGLPISIIEAMAAGLPVIISDICGNGDLIDNNGYLISRKNVDELKQKIKYLYENKHLLQQMGTKSRELFEREFIANVMVEKLIKFYKEIDKKQEI